jgi:oligopeptide/dipeptide ABC transporter ATP-binding protein
MSRPLIHIEDLTTSFRTDDGLVTAVNQVSFDISKGKILGIVGESGCGKSVTALSIMRLIPKPHGVIESGKIMFHGRDLLQVPERDMQSIRGDRIGMIFQEPMTALNPVLNIGSQLSESFRAHLGSSRKDSLRQATQLLEQVGIPEAARRVKQYPHQMSGGQKQRVMIAMALACQPELLIADEPTTALDVTIQAQILELIKKMQREIDMAVMLITHDLGVIAEICDEVIVMYAGKIVEKAPMQKLFRDPQHPYTQGLMKSIPRLADKGRQKLDTIRGMVPSLLHLPKGCGFSNRCDYAVDGCRQIEPKLELAEESHFVSCHRFREI